MGWGPSARRSPLAPSRLGVPPAPVTNAGGLAGVLPRYPGVGGPRCGPLHWRPDPKSSGSGLQCGGDGGFGNALLGASNTKTPQKGAECFGGLSEGPSPSDCLTHGSSLGPSCLTPPTPASHCGWRESPRASCPSVRAWVLPGPPVPETLEKARAVVSKDRGCCPCFPPGHPCSRKAALAVPGVGAAGALPTWGQGWTLGFPNHARSRGRDWGLSSRGAAGQPCESLGLLQQMTSNWLMMAEVSSPAAKVTATGHNSGIGGAVLPPEAPIPCLWQLLVAAKVPWLAAGPLQALPHSPVASPLCV